MYPKALKIEPHHDDRRAPPDLGQSQRHRGTDRQTDRCRQIQAGRQAETDRYRQTDRDRQKQTENTSTQTQTQTIDQTWASLSSGCC
eukprot:2403953-Rhodomonas_salina.1